MTDSLRVTMVAPESIRAGKPVRFLLRLENLTDHPVEAHFLGREIAFDVVVAKQDGSVLWRRLAQAVVPGMLQVRILPPHGSLEFPTVWKQQRDDGHPVAPGTYQVWGLLPSDDPEPRRTPTVSLRITS